MEKGAPRAAAAVKGGDTVPRPRRDSAAAPLPPTSVHAVVVLLGSAGPAPIAIRAGKVPTGTVSGGASRAIGRVNADSKPAAGDEKFKPDPVSESSDMRPTVSEQPPTSAQASVPLLNEMNRDRAMSGISGKGPLQNTRAPSPAALHQPSAVIGSTETPLATFLLPPTRVVPLVSTAAVQVASASPSAVPSREDTATATPASGRGDVQLPSTPPLPRATLASPPLRQTPMR